MKKIIFLTLNLCYLSNAVQLTNKTESDIYYCITYTGNTIQSSLRSNHRKNINPYIKNENDESELFDFLAVSTNQSILQSFIKLCANEYDSFEKLLNEVRSFKQVNEDFDFFATYSPMESEEEWYKFSQEGAFEVSQVEDEIKLKAYVNNVQGFGNLRTYFKNYDSQDPKNDYCCLIM